MEETSYKLWKHGVATDTIRRVGIEEYTCFERDEEGRVGRSRGSRCQGKSGSAVPWDIFERGKGVGDVEKIGYGKTGVA